MLVLGSISVEAIGKGGNGVIYEPFKRVSNDDMLRDSMFLLLLTSTELHWQTPSQWIASYESMH
jgi:hypothetical protein